MDLYKSALIPKFLLDELLPHWIRFSELGPKVTITIWANVAPLPSTLKHHSLPSATKARRRPTVSTTPATVRRIFLDVGHCFTGLAKRESTKVWWGKVISSLLGYISASETQDAGNMPTLKEGSELTDAVSRKVQRTQIHMVKEVTVTHMQPKSEQIQN